MRYAVSPGGLMVHARDDWPCAMCRPHLSTECKGFWMCLNCAQNMIFAVEAGVESARALLDDVTDALALLEFQSQGAAFPTR
ncbi:MAG: hypothetical protein LAN62_17215 [Acidobacteriia bacterium]|nr:hypothetical protein [Terriglobia bacterium]